MNLMDLFVKISVDDQASSQVEALSGKLKTGLATAAKVGAAAIGAASTAIGALGKIGLDYNSQMEQYTTNFTTMLGSQEAAVRKVEELKKFAASTPLSMDDLAKGTQTLLAFGVESENSTGILRQLGDIALGDADKMQRMATAFGKATAQGKLTGDTVQQMIDAGFNPLIKISQAAGETMEETQKRMSAGAISVEELEAAMEAVTSGSGQFAGGMEKASKTTQGLISTLQDNIRSKLGEAFQSVSDKIAELLPKAIEFVNSIDVTDVVQKVESLINKFVEFIPVIAAATSAVVAYKAAMAISSLVDAAVKSVKAFQAANQGATIAQALLNTTLLANPFVLIATLIAAVGTALVTLYMTNEDFRKKVNAAWESVKSTITTVVTAIVEFFKVKIPDAIKTVITWFDELPNKMKEIGTNIVHGIWDGIKAMAGWIKNKVSDFVGGIVSSVKGALGIHSPSRVFAGIGENMALGLSDGWDSEYNKIKRNITNGLDFGTATIDAKATMSGKLQNALTNIGNIGGDINIVVQSVLDGKIIGETAYKYNRQMQRAMGV